MKRFLLIIGLLFVNLSYAQSPDCVLLGPTPSFIIKFKSLTGSSQLDKNLTVDQLKELSNVAKVDFISSTAIAKGYYVIRVSTGASELTAVKASCYRNSEVATIVARLQAVTNIESVSPNLLLLPAENNNSTSPLFAPASQQWNLYSLAQAGGYYGINAVEAWNTSTLQGSDTTVAVLDTGVFSNASLTSNLSPITLTFSNNLAIQSDTTNAACSDCTNSAHGNRVAGIIAADGINDIYGVAPKTKILVINVATRFTGDTCTSNNLESPCAIPYTADIVKALTWVSTGLPTGFPAVPNNLVAVNMSLGQRTSCGQLYSMQSAIEDVIYQGINVVVAAGNSPEDATNIAPANCQGVIAVAATGRTGMRAHYSSYNSGTNSVVKLAAPGGDDQVGGNAGEIYSTVKDGYDYSQGTSMAAPHVAGVIALLEAINPDLTTNQVLEVLLGTTTPFPGLSTDTNSCNNPSASCGAGIVNANAATAFVNSPPNPTWLASPITFSEVESQKMRVTWQAPTWPTTGGITPTIPMVYTVLVDDVPFYDCFDISSTTCEITGLFPSTLYAIKIAAEDREHILQIPSVSNAASETTTAITAPILSFAARNPLNKAIAYVYYTDVGTDINDITYTVQNISGASVTLDRAKNRFIVQPVTTPKAISITITGTRAAASSISNAVTIPSILKDK